MTICPPKDSNTALYHDLVVAGKRSLSDEKRKILRKAAFDIFIERTHKDYMKTMSSTLHMRNIDQVLQGFHSLPKPINDENGLMMGINNPKD